jgi:hypothetical protein
VKHDELLAIVWRHTLYRQGVCARAVTEIAFAGRLNVREPKGIYCREYVAPLLDLCPATYRRLVWRMKHRILGKQCCPPGPIASANEPDDFIEESFNCRYVFLRKGSH